jgi:hypothetical protein
MLMVLLACLLLGVAGAAKSGQGKRVRPWMCLERCDFTSSDIEDHLHQIESNLDVITGVSFEMFNLGPEGVLVANDLTEVYQELQMMNLETFAMVSSYPYPPEFIDYMRFVFKNPKDFVAATIKQGSALGLTGFNCDFEPIGNITAQDASDYAAFLTYWATSLHKYDMQLTVDVASWSILWDFEALAETAVDTVMTMSTYTNNDTSWARQLQKALDNIPLTKLGIGLQDDQDINMTSSQITQRLRSLDKAGVTEVDIWKMPLADDLIEGLKAWVSQ